MGEERRAANLPCVFNCDVTTGTGISVTLGTETPGVDFALALGGSIAGTVTDAATTDPLANTQVTAYDGAGTWLRSDWTASDGTYSIGGLPGGTYYARTSSSP